jgi:hypothetical protein
VGTYTFPRPTLPVVCLPTLKRREFDRDLRDAIDGGKVADGLVTRDLERADRTGWRDAAELVVVDQQ